MNYFYINLDREHARAQHVEQQFAACSRQSLQRFSAIDTQWIAGMRWQGSIRPVEKACYMSHLTLLKGQQATRSWNCAFLRTMSAFFRKQSKIIQAAIAAAANTPWDILFTNVCIPDLHTMIDLFMLHRQLQTSQGLQLLPLQNMNFAGSVPRQSHFRKRSLRPSDVPVLHEIIAPYMVAMLRPQPSTAAIAQPEPAASAVSRPLQSFFPPDPLHPLVIDPNALIPKHMRDHPIPGATISGGQLYLCASRPRPRA